MIEKKLILCFIAMIIIIISIASAENYNCDEDFRRLTSAAAQPGAYDDRDAGEGLMLDVNPGSSAKSKVADGIKGPVGPPIPNAVDFRKIGNQNKDQLFHLRSNLEIPDEHPYERPRCTAHIPQGFHPNPNPNPNPKP